MRTPFFYGNPIPPELFKGRRVELDQIRDLIADHGQSAAVIGEPRMGRSSLLKRLASPAAREEMQRRSAAKLLFAEADGEGLADGFDRARFWAHVFEQFDEDGVVQAAGRRLADRYQECVAAGFEPGKLSRLVNRFGIEGHRLVLFVDDLDYLLDRHASAHADFFAGLRSLSSSAVLAVVFTSRMPLEALNAAVAHKGSPFFNNFREIRLRAFASAEVDEILDIAESRFSPDDRAFVHEATGGQPDLVQATADALWSALRAGHASAGAKREAAAALARITERTSSEIWKRWPPRTRYVVAAITAAHLEEMGDAAGWPSPDGAAANAVAEDAAILAQEIRALEDHGFVRGQGTYRIRPAAMLWWIASKVREKALTAQRWSGWIQEEGWDSILSPARRQTWERAIRPRAGAITTDLERLVALSRGLPSRPRHAMLAASPFREAPEVRPVRIFYSYAPEDERERAELEKHLSALEREGLIETWGARDVGAGENWRAEVEAQIDRADLVLLLLSADFLASDYRYNEELVLLRERLENPGVRGFLVRVRPVDAGTLWFTKLDALPSGERAITGWTDRDQAWRDVAAGIRRAVEEMGTT